MSYRTNAPPDAPSEHVNKKPLIVRMFETIDRMFFWFFGWLGSLLGPISDTGSGMLFLVLSFVGLIIGSVALLTWCAR